MASLEQVFNKREFITENLPPVYRTLNIDGRKLREQKNLKLCGKANDLAQLGNKFIIKDAFGGNIVRIIEVDEKTIKIDACIGVDGIIHIPKDLPIYYEEWFMDRGSYVFLWNYHGKDQLLKLATEGDIVESN